MDRSPVAVSPPPSAMTKAELGLVGASNFMACPFDSCSMGVANVTASFVFFWPLAGAGHRKTRIGASPMATVAVRRLAIHQPRKMRRGEGPGGGKDTPPPIFAPPPGRGGGGGPPRARPRRHLPRGR